MSVNGLTGTLTYKRPAVSVIIQLTEKVFQLKLVSDVVLQSSGCGGCTLTLLMVNFHKKFLGFRYYIKKRLLG